MCVKISRIPLAYLGPVGPNRLTFVLVSKLKITFYEPIFVSFELVTDIPLSICHVISEGYKTVTFNGPYSIF